MGASEPENDVRRADLHDGGAERGVSKRERSPGSGGRIGGGLGGSPNRSRGALAAPRGGAANGAYMPPHKRARLAAAGDSDGVAAQREAWEALRRSLNGIVNKVNAANIGEVLPELFQYNVVRGRGLLVKALMRAQLGSPGYTPTFAALMAVINTKFPEIGELLLGRVVLQFRRAYRRNDKQACLALAKFVAHLVNHHVAHEILALQLLMLLLEKPTDVSVEIAVAFTKECGACLHSLSPQGLHSIFERLRNVLHEGQIDRRVQFVIEGLFAVRKTRFADFPAVPEELDLVEAEDQITHDVGLDDELDAMVELDVFSADPEYEANEAKYAAIRESLLGSEGGEGDEREELPPGDADAGGSAGGVGGGEIVQGRVPEEPGVGAAAGPGAGVGGPVTDMTETNLTNLRRTIYLTIMSSMDFEEAGHKLMKIRLLPGEEVELCTMLLECCSQERTYLRYYGLLGQRLCEIDRKYRDIFDDLFARQYSMIHRLETNKLRNVGKFYAHLLCTNALPWTVMAYVRLTEADTSSSSRIFIKILFQEIAEQIGLRTFRDRLASNAEHCGGIFPRDTAPNMRFAINFYTSIGLGGLTDELREHLKNLPALLAQQRKEEEERARARARDSPTSSRSTYTSRSYTSRSTDSRSYTSRSYSSRSSSSQSGGSASSYSQSSRSFASDSRSSGDSGRSKTPPRR